jgi:hypothetical protein
VFSIWLGTCFGESKMNIELNSDEANVLINLIDVAVKAAGLQAAEAGLHFKRKIEEAGKPAAVETEEGHS